MKQAALQTNRLGWLFLGLAFGLGSIHPARAQYIQINVSMKLIIDVQAGVPPSLFSSNRMDEWFAYANLWLANHQRGYRLRVVDPYLFLWFPDPDSPCKWFNSDLKNVPSVRRVFETEAKSDPRYFWNSNAVNIYVNNGPYSASSFTYDNMEVITTGYGLVAHPDYTNSPVLGAGNLLHEIGHYFELFHTFGGCDCLKPELACYSTNGMWVNVEDNPKTTDVVEDIADTLPEGDCFTQDQIARANFNQAYVDGSPAQQLAVDNTFFNLMSYHHKQMTNVLSSDQYPARMNVLTEEQLDKWTEFANLSRRHSLTGWTLYASPTGASHLSGLTRAHALDSVTGAIRETNPSGGDIVLLLPGSYNERLTLTNRVTLRATRGGWATIGR